jgi:(R,R)-butanediol dehydrogenase/meso-butanediol dehydrogenase/diacetyl reductase
MKAAIFDEPGKPLRIAEVPDPEPAPHQVLVRIAACGVCGSDLHATLPGGIARPGGVLGHELTGTIDALGPGHSDDLAIGQRVQVMPFGSCGRCPHCQLDEPEACADPHPFGSLGPGDPNGGYAERIAVSARDVVPIPEGVELDTAALTEPLGTGLVCARNARLEIGDRVLVLGAGPIGLAATIWLRFLGARAVVVSDPVAHRRSLASRVGATHTIDAAGTDDLAGEAADLAGGPPDVVVEAVGRPGMLDQAVSLVRAQGRVVTGGVCMEPDSFDHIQGFLKEPTIRTVRSYTRADQRFILEMVATGRVDPRPLISHHVGLDALPDAFEALRRPTDQCKVMVQP